MAQRSQRAVNTTGTARGSTGGTLVAAVVDVDGGERTVSGDALSSSSGRRPGRRGGRLREPGGGSVLTDERGTLAANLARTTPYIHRRAPFVAPARSTYWLTVATPPRLQHRLASEKRFWNCSNEPETSEAEQRTRNPESFGSQ